MTMRAQKYLPAFVLMLSAAACGSSSSGLNLSPTTIGTITGVSLAVNPPGVGASVAATATVQLSTGSSAAVASGFTSDTPSVATVTTAGVITGVSIGDVTISIDYQGFKASKKVRVLPNYNGIYYGTYTIDSCTETGDFVPLGYCAQLTSSATLPLAFNNAQSAELTTMAGQFAIGSLIGTATGAISSTGALTYAGAFVSGTSRIDLQNFTGSAPAVGQMAGHFEEVWTDSSITGQVFVSCTIHDMTRSSGGLSTSALPNRETPAGPLNLLAAVKSSLRR